MQKKMIERIKELGLVNFVIITITLVLEVISLLQPNVSSISIINIIIHILAFIFGIIYCFLGYSKNASMLYKLFMLFYSISALITIISTLYDETNPTLRIVKTIAYSICFLGAVVLTLALNLGEKKSTAISITLLLLYTVCFMLTALNASVFKIIASIQNIPLAIIACVFVQDKYNDKAIRGSK